MISDLETREGVQGAGPEARWSEKEQGQSEERRWMASGARSAWRKS